MSDPIRFYHRGRIETIDTIDPTRTVLQYLREDAQCTGTKEGCAEGDCGACTVVIGELEGEQLTLKAVNACIQFMPTLDGKALFTVEDLACGQQLHPVQQALVDCHGSQCGFCTPGFVMSLWPLYEASVATKAIPLRAQIDDTLSGNLCRCTGYRPIIEAAQTMCQLPPVQFDPTPVRQALLTLQSHTDLVHSGDHGQFHAPRTLASLLGLKAELPQARILAGGTDIGLWVTKQMKTLDTLIYVGKVPELQQLHQVGDELVIGAAVDLNRAYQALCEAYPVELHTLWKRFASMPVRNAGTLGGNVANGSPIGDSMPWLIALGAQIDLASVRGMRSMALEAFYLGYQSKDLREDEVVSAIRVPLHSARRERMHMRTYKLAKRHDQDISAVCAAFCITLDKAGGTNVNDARIAFGGMAATPSRAGRAESALQTHGWNEAGVRAAMDALDSDYQPISDMRASQRYRKLAARNLLWRFWLETNPTQTATGSAPIALDVFSA